MEELNLEDLNFESAQLFDDDGGVEEIVKDTENTDKDTALAETLTKEENNISDDSLKSGKDKDSQESVANSKNNQVQESETSDNGKGSNSSSPKLNETEQLYSNLAAEFKSKGVLPGLENIDSIKSIEDLNSALQKEVDSRLDSVQSKLKEAISAGVDPSEVSEKAETIRRLESVDEEFLRDDSNIEFRKQAIAQDFIDKGYTSERAEIHAQRSVDAGTDIEDAEFALKNIIAFEKESLDKVVSNARDAEANSLNKVKDYIERTPEVLPNVKLTNSQKDELYKQITTEVQDRNNAFMVAQQEDPVGSRVKLEAFFYLTKGFSDFSVFSGPTETRVSNQIENLLRGANFTQEGIIDTNVPDENSTFKLTDLKDLQIE
jgi:hypothetical protein